MHDYSKPSYQWFTWAYANLPWSDISINKRRVIVAMRMGCPGTCPICGGPDPELWTKDGKYPDDDSNYYWSCRSCKGKADRKKNRRPPHIHIKK